MTVEIKNFVAPLVKQFRIFGRNKELKGEGIKVKQDLAEGIPRILGA